MTGRIFGNWDETHSELWSHQPIRLDHQMHRSAAFSLDHLARLIENYPREHYSLVQTGRTGQACGARARSATSPAARCSHAISRGRLCLNLRRVAQSTPATANCQAIFEELGATGSRLLMPNHSSASWFPLPTRRSITTPICRGSACPDPGAKRVYLYPARTVHDAGAP